MILFVILSTIILTSNIHALTPVGGNLDGLRDWSHSLPYVNLIKQVRQWGSPDDPSEGNVTIDPITGWPTNDFGIILVSDSFDLGGTYLLHAHGNAEVSIPNRLPGLILNKTYDSITDTLSALIILPQNASKFRLSFRNTTGPGLENITVLQPGYNLSSETSLSTLMLAHLSRFNIIRFMEWMKTNNNNDVNWNDTTPVYWPLYTTKHNPWESIPMIINQFNTSKDVWINVPVSASNDYVITLAKLMLDQLRSDVNIYLEYSNEVWNPHFSQFTVNWQAANDSVYNDGDPFHLNYDHSFNLAYWLNRRIGAQTKRILDLFKTVFGDENVGQWKRVRPILGGQSSNSTMIIDTLDYLNVMYGPPSSYLHGFALAPYVYLGKYKSLSNLTVDEVIDGFNTSVQAYLPEQGWSAQATLGVHATYAAWYKLVVHGYEGGPSTIAGCGNCSLNAKTEAQRDPRMTEVCVTYLKGWYQFGFQALNWFDAGASKTTYTGAFGLLEDMRQETLIDTTSMFNSTSYVAQLPRPSPKLKAIDIIRASTINLNFGITLPTHNFNATNFMNHSVPYPDPDLRNLQTNASFYYPIQIEQSPLLINLVVYVAGLSGLLDVSINGENTIQIRTPSTGSTTKFEQTSMIQLHVNQSVVPSLVTLRLKVIENGYSIRSFDITSST